MSAMNFRVTLLRVNEQLSSQQLENLKFLSRTVIPNAHMDRIRQSLDLFDVLEQRGKLSPNNIDFLRMLLESADCSDALRELQYIPSRGSEQEDQEFHFRKCLLRIAVELSSVEFDNLKFTLKERLQQSTDRIYSATHLFQLLIQRQIVTSTDLRALYELLFNMGRKDLSEVVNRYMLDIGRQPYQMFHQGPYTNSQHLPTPVEETPPSPNPNLPGFRTISSGVRTNQPSMNSTLASMSPSHAGSGNSTLASPPGTIAGGRESGLPSPVPRVDSGLTIRSVSSNPSLDSSYPSSTTGMSSLESRTGIAYGSGVHDYNRMRHISSHGHGMNYEHIQQQQNSYGQSQNQVQSPPSQPGYSQVQPPPSQPGYGQVQLPPSQPGYGQVQSPHAQRQFAQEHIMQSQLGQVQSPPPHVQQELMSRELMQQGPYNQARTSEPPQPGGVHSHGSFIKSPDDHLQSPFAEQFLTFKLDEERNSQNQQLQKELAQKDHELRAKEQDIDRYQAQLVEMHAHIDTVEDQQKGKEQEYQKKITDLESILKQMTTEAVIQRRDMQQLHHQLQLANPRSTHDDGDFYKMSTAPHGICLIINNYKFHHLDPQKRHPDRGGAEVDVHNLSQTFKYLCYKIEVIENVPSDEMQAIMLRMANRDHSQYDSFVCCILTHGERDVVHGSNCEPVNLHDLAGVMKMCPSMHGKPKLFFIQACRGELESKGFELPERDTGGGPYSNTIPREADFYFGFATPIGSSAYRSRRYGSWFISEVCQVFIKHAYTHDLGGMMTKVNKNVSDAYTKDGYKQSPESVDRLRFRVHFFRFLKSRGAIGGQ